MALVHHLAHAFLDEVAILTVELCPLVPVHDTEDLGGDVVQHILEVAPVEQLLWVAGLNLSCYGILDPTLQRHLPVSGRHDNLT